MFISRPWRQRGLSLIELIIFMVVMGIAAVAVLQMLNLSAKASADPVRRKQALLLAESYLEEVELARFTFCDPSDSTAATAADTNACSIREVVGQEPGGGSRPFDNVSDYANQLAVPTQAFGLVDHLTDASGAVLPGLSGFTVTVELNLVTALGPAGTSITSGALPASLNALRITVKVVYAGDPADTNNPNVVVLDGYRTRYAPNSVP